MFFRVSDPMEALSSARIQMLPRGRQDSGGGRSIRRHRPVSLEPQRKSQANRKARFPEARVLIATLYFSTLADAQVALRAYNDFNNYRSHSSLGQQTRAVLPFDC